MRWNVSDMPRLDGWTALVTGGASGIGFQVARRLGARGAAVTVLARDVAKAARSVELLRAQGAPCELEPLDLASLRSIAAFAERWGGRPIHLLLNAAGVVALPRYTRTTDGFEMHMGTTSSATSR